MPKKLKWVFIEKMKLKPKEFQDWYTCELAAVVDYHNKPNCNCCNQSGLPHKMSNMLLSCKNELCNKDRLCNVRYKINKCENKEIYHLYQLNEHEENIKPVGKKHGIQNKIKDYINDLITEKNISMPKKIQIKLSGKKYKEKIEKDELPSLEQIQNYVKYLKRQVFDHNKRSEVNNFINANGYHENIERNDFFTFGEVLGNGTDDDHFQVGFTSASLMSRIPIGVVFHCDATYKIVKVGYPLIVFGLSDINRKFYPLCFMFTSHETNKDYANFFKSVKKLSILLNIMLSPEYMCIDASKSMAYGIRKVFELCLILMCWFHLKSNVRLKIIILK